MADSTRLLAARRLSETPALDLVVELMGRLAAAEEFIAIVTHERDFAQQVEVPAALDKAAEAEARLAVVTRERDLARWAMLSVQERTVLAWLWANGPAPTMKAAAGLGLTRSGLCNVTKRLIAAGLVVQPKHGVYQALPSALTPCLALDNALAAVAAGLETTNAE